MRIAVDARYLSGRPSGIGRYSANLLRALAGLDTPHAWHVLVQPGYVPPPELLGCMTFHPVPHAPLSPGTLLHVGGVIDRLRCDVAHLHCPVMPLRLRTPFIVTVHDWQPLRRADFSAGRPAPLRAAYEAFYRWMYPRTVRRARAVLCDSEATRRDTLYFVPAGCARGPGGVQTVLLGLDPAFLAPATPPDPAWLRQHLLEAAPFVLYVGSTRPNKELPTLLRAFAALRAAHPTLRLVLALTPDRFWAATRRLIPALQLEASVTVLEHASEAELIWLYRHAAVLAQATAAEGFGFPVLEGMACGCPVVIGNDASLPELAGSGPDAAALAVAPGDPAALQAALRRVLEDEPLAARLRAAGPPRAAQFTWRRTAEQTLAALERVGP